MRDDTVITVFAIMAVFGFPIAALIISRWMAHRERIEMIRNGFAPPPGKVDWRATRSPSAGPYAGYAAEQAQATLRKGITVAFVGLALTIGLSFIGYQDSIPFGVRWHPGPWLLGGLVPLFVGLAQILSAVLSGASLSPARRGDFPPPGPPEAPQPGNQTFEGPYTYRPSSTQELRPPPSPPERRQ